LGLCGQNPTLPLLQLLHTSSASGTFPELKEKGICFIGEPQTIKEWYMRCVYFRDPEGNLFEICQDGVE